MGEEDRQAGSAAALAQRIYASHLHAHPALELGAAPVYFEQPAHFGAVRAPSALLDLAGHKFLDSAETLSLKASAHVATPV